MRKLFLPITLLALLFTSAVAQTPAEQARRSEEIVSKAAKLDILNQVLPVLMTKEQLRKILPSIERARQLVREAEKEEYKALLKLEGKLDTALKEAHEKGQVPNRALLNEVFQTYNGLSNKRRLVADVNTGDVLKVFLATVNEGQKKAAANALDPRQFDRGIKVDEMKDEDKLKLFVREILLHPLAYDVLVKLSISGTAGG
ncbi:MAG TPA: hypothetical protein VEX38_01675 [Fimbriimonadaceae bacterium]|nr:hypothetical protein [Fimbriimonadaceae bacterium]